MPTKLLLTFLTLTTLFTFGATAHAQSLRIDGSGERMRVDGSLREWRGARFGTLGSGDDAALRFALATADNGLYVGAEVTDDRLVRGKGVGGAQDALVLTLAMPDGRGGFSAVDVWLHPGEAGRSKAAAGLAEAGRAPRAESRIQIVEGPRDGGAGYVIEAFVPWSLVPGADMWEQGRGALRFEDVDAAAKPRVETTLATATSARPSELPRLIAGEGTKDFLGAFLSSQNLVGIEPRFDFRANVNGDGAPERVVLVDRFVVVYGPHYKKGEAFGFFKLPFGMGGGLKSADIEDLTGDGLGELVLTLRQRNDLGARELWMVMSLAGEDPRPMFAVELRKEANGGFVEDKLSVDAKGRGPKRIHVEPGRAQGLDASTFQEGRATDAEAILLPWGEVSSRTYQFDGSRFAIVDEKRREKAESAAASAPSPRPAQQQEEELAPIEPSVEAVLALFKKSAKLAPDARPTRHQHANFFGGAAQEQLFVFGATLVVLGGDLGDGGRYMAYGLPIASPADFLYVGSADVTGDRVREIFVRIKQPLSGAEGVHREIALVLRFDEQGRFGRALAVDVTRRQGTNVVANRVRTRSGKLVIEPGTSEGWSAQSYPFSNEPTGGVERLLLPWADAPVSYHLEGSQLVADAR